jgi:hypothetical protein
VANNKTLTDLRTHLFATLDSLRDDINPMDIERAKAIGDVAQTIINSAKVEVEYLRAVGGTERSSFLSVSDSIEEQQKPVGVLGIKTHRMR